MAEPVIPPRRGELLTPEGMATTRFSEFLERSTNNLNLTEGTDNRIASVEGFISVYTAIIKNVTDRLDDFDRRINDTNQSALIKTLLDRIDDLEKKSNFDSLNSKINRVSARVDALIDELIAEIKKVQPDLEQENRKVVLLRENILQLKLLNARTEEAYETDIDEDDL